MRKPGHPVLLILAAVMTAAYLLLLFGGNYQARARLIELSENKLRHDVHRTAGALQLYFAERGKDLMTLQRLPEIDAFYANRALGMSLRYGLMASLMQIHERLLSTRDNLTLASADKAPASRLFNYFAIVENEGDILTDSEASLPGGAIPNSWAPLITPSERNTPTWLTSYDRKLLVSVPLYYKDTKVATLIAELAMAPIYRQILSGRQPDPDRFDFLKPAHGAFVLANEVEPGQRRALSEYERLEKDSARSRRTRNQDSLLIKVPLPVGGLELLSIVDFSHVRHSAISMMPLAIASTLPIALFAVMVALSKSDRARREAAKVAAENSDLERLVKERTRDLEITAEEAKRANQAKSEFLANMSHELRTPMHAILSFARLGLKRSHAAEQAKLNDYFNKISGSGERLLTLLNDLLDIAKLEAGRMQCEFKETDFNVVIDSAVNELEPLTARRGLTFQRELPPSLAMVFDEMRIGQVVRNLLSNAVKFTAENSRIDLHASFLTVDGRQMLELRIEDQGPGIPEAELEGIFDKFIQSSRTATRSGGTGLGLAICKEIIATHQGRIWAENRVESGACFVVQLPVGGPAARAGDDDRVVMLPGAETHKRTTNSAAPQPRQQAASQ